MGEVVVDILNFLFQDALTKFVAPVLGVMETVALSPETINDMPFIDNLYVAMQAIGIGILIIITSWHALKSMMVGWGFDAEEPHKIAVKAFVAGFLVFYIKDIMMKCIEIGGLMIGYINDSVSGNMAGAGLFQMLANILATGGVLLILSIILIFQCIGLLYRMFTRLVMCAILLVCSPLAVATMVAKQTEGFWQGFIKLFVGNIAIQLIQSACVAAIILSLAAMTPELGTDTAVTANLFFGMMLLIALVGVTNKLEDIVRDLSMSVGIGRDMQGALSKISSAGYTVSSLKHFVPKK